MGFPAGVERGGGGWSSVLCLVRMRCILQQALDKGVYSTCLNRSWTKLKGAHAVTGGPCP